MKGQSGKKEALEMVWGTGQGWTGLGDSEGAVVHTLFFLPVSGRVCCLSVFQAALSSGLQASLSQS